VLSSFASPKSPVQATQNTPRRNQDIKFKPNEKENPSG
jgi:hypothetical protein